MKRPRKYWPWLVAVFIPLWLIGVAGELLDARRLESEGTAVDGRITSAKWIKGRRGGPQLDCTVAWNYDDRTYTKEFRLPSRLGEAYADNDGNVIQPRIEVRCASSKPQVAALVILPPDPVWGSILISCVGFCVVTGIIWIFIQSKTGRP